MRRFLFLFLFLSTQLFILAQDLPLEAKFSYDNHFLKLGGVESKGLYNEHKLHEIRVYFKESNFWTIMQGNYASKTNLMAKLVYNGKTLDSIGIRFKGQTSYSKSGTSEKKSFDIELDAFIDGQDIEGDNTLNLNNSFEDASFMREVFYYHLSRNHTPAAKASFVRLYINDIDWGIYQNIQQLNKDFLKEWWPSNDGTNWRADAAAGTTGGGGGVGPGWGDGTAALNNLGADTTSYKKYYTIKSTESTNPWNELKDACQALNTIPIADLHTKLDQYFDVDKILWHLATEVLFADDDSYIFKGKMDYYLYKDKETGRITTYDYDGNSALKSKNVSWSAFYNETKVNYPLLNRVLANKTLRQRYIAHLKTLVKDYCNETNNEDIITKFDNLISSVVGVDSKAKVATTTYKNELAVLKKFMTDRKNNLLNNAEVKVESPTLSNLTYSTENLWQSPDINEEVLIEVEASHSLGLSEVNVYVGEGLSGRFNEKISLNDNGTNGDKTANDKIYSAKIGGRPAATWVRVYAEAIANNTANTVAFFPEGAEHEVMIYQVNTGTSLANDLAINEFMANNETGPKDEVGSYADWIEIFNKTNNEIDLSGYHLSDNKTNTKKWQVPNSVKIPANGYLIFWADEDQLQGLTHTSFKLASAGETIILADKNGAVIDSISYVNAIKDKSFARIPNGTGNFVEIANYTFNKINTPNASNEIAAKEIKVFPNPSSNKINVFGIDGPITIYNSLGQKMYSSIIKDGEAIDITNWKNGLYFLRSEYAKTVKFYKF